MSADGHDVQSACVLEETPRWHPTVQQVREAARAEARYNITHASSSFAKIDAYDALASYVAECNAADMAPHSLLGDIFCDEYDAEYADRQRQGWDSL